MRIVDSGTAAEDQNAGKGRTKIDPRPCAAPIIYGHGPGGKNSLARWGDQLPHLNSIGGYLPAIGPEGLYRRQC
ncbi:MAG: hypothetical protein V3T66_05100 [Alphaproteobacteria bacterium]